MAGSSARSGATSCSSVLLRTDQNGLDYHEAVAAQRLWNGWKWREMKDPAHRGDLVRHRCGPVAPGAQHLNGPLDGPEHRARVQLWGRKQLELDRGHNTEAAAPAPDGPEQIGLVISVDSHEPTLGSDQLDCGDAVGREPSAPREPAHAASERIADDANVGRGAMEHHETLRCRGLDDVGPERSRLDARAMGAGIDLDATHTRRLHEDRVVSDLQRGRSVAGSLRGDPETMCDRELDDLDHVLRRIDQRDGERPLINREVPGPTSVVPVGLAGKHDLAVDTAAQSADVFSAGTLDSASRDPATICRVRRLSVTGRERDPTPSAFGSLACGCRNLELPMRVGHSSRGRPRRCHSGTAPGMPVGSRVRRARTGTNPLTRALTSRCSQDLVGNVGNPIGQNVCELRREAISTSIGEGSSTS